MSFLRHKGVWVLLVASLAFNFGLASTFGVRAYQNLHGPCDPAGPSGPGRGDHGRLAERLNLSPEQADQIAEIKNRFMEQAGELHRQKNQAHQVLADLITADEPDNVAIEAQIKVLTDLMGEMNVEMAHHFLEIKALLTAEQNQAFNEMVRRRHADGGGPDFFGRRFGNRGRFHHGVGPMHGRQGQNQREGNEQIDEPD